MNAYVIAQFPLIAGFVLLLVSGSIWPRITPRVNALTQLITLLALGSSALLTATFLMPGEEFFAGAVRVTLIGKALSVVVLLLALLAASTCADYLAKVHARPTEFRIMLMAQAFGLFHLPLAGDLTTAFIAFELVSIPSYILAGFNFRDGRANEAGLKYLILGAVSSALFLLGLTFLYGATGEIQFVAIQNSIGGYILDGEAGLAPLLLVKAGLALLLTALLFKVAAAPFHAWLPDVYQGANLASLAVIAAPAKIALFGFLAVILWGPFAYLHETWKPLLLIAAALSAVLGNLQALSQRGIKRVLAYSSTVNAGFILLALFLDSAGPFLLYLAAYGVTVVGIVATLMALGTRTADVEEHGDLRGLGRRHPWLAGMLTLFLFSLAGIPLTGGFAAKFAVVSDALLPGYTAAPWFLPVLVGSLLLGLLSFAFYFRMVRQLWLAPETGGEDPAPRAQDGAAVLTAALCALLVLVMGVLLRVPFLP